MQQHFQIRIALFPLLATAWLCLPAEEEWELAPPAPAIQLQPARLEAAAQLACRECHAAVVEEWATSAHALAWVDEVYQEELADRKRAELCHDCHRPTPLLSTGALEVDALAARELDPHLGVDCASCHLGPAGVWLSESGRATPAHATQASASLATPASNELCASCHSTTIGPVVGIAKDFLASAQPAAGKSCVGCHMAAVERKPTAGGESYLGRSHALQTPRDPAFLRRAFALEASLRGDTTVLTLRNQAGHRVPGLKGRELRFNVEARGANGESLATAELTIDKGRYLPIDGSLEIVLAARATTVFVRAVHQDPRAKEAHDFLELTLEPTP